jgi:RHS repeat-associated protein
MAAISAALILASSTLPVLPPPAPAVPPGHISNAPATPADVWAAPERTADPLTTPNAPGSQATVVGTSAASIPGHDKLDSGLQITAASLPLAPPAANDKGAGDFTALPGTSSGTWGTAGQTGAFTWSYPLTLRPAPAGDTPELALSYDSSRVDGLTSATNNQASAIGDGWALAGAGRIAQKFVPCNDQGVTGSFDLCGNPGGQNISISFGGRSGALVKDTTTGAWKLSRDDGSKVEYLKTAGTNGTFDGGYWKITDPSGTQYFFGLNKLPGWASGKATTNSVETVPVGAATTSQPCSAATFAASLCQQARGWNLDYVVDVHGNSQAFYYGTAINYYRAQAGTGTILPYVRSSRLDRVDYGMRAGSELTATAPLRIKLDYTARCTGVNCTAGTDVPTGLTCPAAGPCTIQSPTFFMDYRLTGIQTESLVAAGTYQAADRWNLSHSMPDPGDTTKPSLWLGSIQHLGLNTRDGQTTVTDPAVVFSGQTLQNRVWVVDGLAPLNRFRITAVKTVTGATIGIIYNGQDCTPTSLPASPETNTRRCFPQWWTPTTPIVQPARMDYFHIYPVASVGVDAGPGGTDSATQTTNYSYIGAPAWKYPEATYQSGTAGAKLTWSVAAGWSQVKTVAAGSTTTTTYLRGLDNTPSNKTGGKRAVQQTASDGTSVTDSIWFAGHELETQTFLGDTTTLLSTSVTLPWASSPTATGPASLGSPTARYLGISKNWAKAATDAGWRTTSTDTTFDSRGRTGSVSHQLDTSTTADDTCTTTTFADGTGPNLLALPAVTSTYAGACTATGAPTGNLLKAQQVLYDTSTSAVPGSTGYIAPTKGDISRTLQAKSITGTAVSTWQSGPTTKYDALGRLATSTDTTTGTARTTTTSYTPATGLATSTTTTNPLGWTQTTNMDAVRGQTTSTVDANGSTTTYSYDANGRVTAMWDATRPKATNAVPTTATSYNVSQTQPSWVKTEKVNYRGAVLPEFKIYDGLGRLRQTQMMSVQNGTIATDTMYNAAGNKRLERNRYYLTTAPDGTLRIPSLAVPSSTEYQYDPAGRLTRTRALAYDNQEQRATTITYAGTNSVTTTGPGNEPATTVTTDAAGNTASRKIFHGTAPSGPADTASYTYNPLQQMTELKDSSGISWTWTYDPLGNQTSAKDPDTGTTANGYDSSGRLSTVTDPTGTVSTTNYDTLDRITTVSTTLPGQSAKTLISHTYDTEKKGQLASSTRFNGPAQDQPVTTTISGYNANYQPGSVKIQLPGLFGTLAGTYETKSTYGKSGLPAYVTYPAIGGLPAEMVSNSYDDWDQPSSLSSQFGQTYVGNTQRDNLNNLGVYSQYDNKLFTAGADTMGSTKVYFTWDHTTGRLQEMKSINDARSIITDLGTTRYTYEPSGQLTSRELSYTTRPGGADASDYQCYDYDYAGRLADAWTPSSKNCSGGFSAAALGGAAPYAQSFEYNQNGDRAKTTRYTPAGGIAATETYSYPAAGENGPHRLQSVQRSTGTGSVITEGFTWDSAGRMTGRAGQTLTYTPDGKLASTTGASSVPRNPTPNASTGVDPAAAGSAAAQRYYTSDGNLVGIVDGTGTTVTIGNATAFRATEGETSATRAYMFMGKCIAQRTILPGATATSVDFITGDSVNTAQVMTGPTTGGGTSGISVVKRHTDPAGLIRGPTLNAIGQAAFTAATPAATSPGSNAANTTGFSAATGYLGGTADTASALTHLGARDYDPVLGIFTAPDPVLKRDEAKNFSPYIYAEGDPVNDSDPSGLMILGPIVTDDSSSWHSPGAKVSKPAPAKPAPAPYIPPVFQPAPPPAPPQANSFWNWETAGMVLGIVAGVAICAGTAGVGCVVAGAAIGAALSTAGYVADRGGHVETLQLAEHFGSNLAMGLIPICKGGFCKVAGKEATGALDSIAIKAGSSGGQTAGKVFPKSVKEQVLKENADTCVYCRMKTDSPQVDHAIPRSRGGDATVENGQTTCGHCNASKGARDVPVTPPVGYRGEWPPPWW